MDVPGKEFNFIFNCTLPHRVGVNRKHYQQLRNADQKSIEIVFSIAIEISVSNDFLSTFLDSIGLFDCRLPGVIT